MPVPVHELATIEQYLAVLDGYPDEVCARRAFSYCNGGYVVLALIAERAAGVPFYDLVQQRVCDPAGMADTEFLRSDELPGRTALGYLEVDGAWRSNVLHLPVRGSGDGGIYSTVADLSALWRAFFAGRIVSADWVREMVRARSDTPSYAPLRPRHLAARHERRRVHGRLRRRSLVPQPRRSDAGITHSVISNTTDGAWPIARFLASDSPTTIG